MRVKNRMSLESYIKYELGPLLRVPGQQGYLVGGSLRDLILGHRPDDFDMIVSGDPLLYARKLSNRLHGRWCTLGRPPKAIQRVITPTLCIDIDGIKKADLFHDLSSRDFRMNAMACDLTTGRFIDPFKGRDDLNRRTIRMISEHAFENDPLRVLRAHRFAAVLGFDIAPATRRAMRAYAEQLAFIAGERIWVELQFILAAAHSTNQILEMARQTTLKAILPELTALKGCFQNRYHSMDVFEHSLAAYQAMEAILASPGLLLPPQAAFHAEAMDEKARTLMKLAVLLHDIGKPETRSRNKPTEPHFYGHASHGADKFMHIAARFKMANRQRDWVGWIIRHHQRPLSLFLANKQTQGFGTKTVGRFLKKAADKTPHLLLVALADTYAKKPAGHAEESNLSVFIKNFLVHYYHKVKTIQEMPKLINGRDLIHHFGLDPSPFLGELLDQLEEERLAGLIKTRQEALQRVSRLINDNALHTLCGAGHHRD